MAAAPAPVEPDLPLAHIRRPDLPWRQSNLTECGQRLADVKAEISRDELLAKVRKYGKQRMAYSTCMTCLSTAQRWPTWQEDPVRALAREFYSVQDPRLADELRALQALVEAHRDEFDAAMLGLLDTVSLNARRARRRIGFRG